MRTAVTLSSRCFIGFVSCCASGEADATKLLKMIDMLEDNDDVNTVYANFDVDADVLEKIAG